MKQVKLLVVTLFSLAIVVSCAQNQPATEAGAKAAKSAKVAEAKSQAINQISYDAATQELILGFERGTYSFAGVPAEVHDGLMKSDSQGAYYQSEIRGKYKSTKVK